MQITKEALDKEIANLDKKIAAEVEQMKNYAQWVLDRADDPEALVSYEFSRSFGGFETKAKEYIARREAFRDILNNLEA